ncbi:MAG: 3-oxoacyl-ACP synthase [Flavobacteriaceae bacterium]|nr:3-oxoacyl-ACP synthase [Flavobacteriaceae bacterium]
MTHKNIQIKENLLQACTNFVERKSSLLDNIIKSSQQDLLSETKSSAGDKHETGRAMIQLEMEKASQQFSYINQLKEVINRVEIYNKSKLVKLGSLVTTNLGAYFLAVSVGKEIVFNKDYYIISPQSPIGKLIIGKMKDDRFIFNNKTYQIVDID